MTKPVKSQFDTTTTNTTPDLKVVEGFDDAPRSKMPKAVKYLAGTAVGLVLVAGVAGIAATQLIDQAAYKKMAAEKIAEKTGYTVDWDGNIGISLLPLPHVSVKNLTVANGKENVLTVKEASVDVALLPLLSKKVDIRNVTIDAPVVTLTTSASGQQMWMTDVLKSGAKTEAPAVQGDASAASTPMDIVINKVNITDGTFIWDDKSAKAPQKIEHLDVRLGAESLNGPFDLDGSLSLSGQVIDVKATSGKIDGKGSQIPVQLKLSVPKSDVSASFSGGLDLTPSVRATGDITAQIGDVEKAAKNFTGSDLSLPKGIGGKLNLSGKIVTNDKRVALDDMLFSLGTLAYQGGFAVSGYGESTPPQLNFSLTPTGKSASGASPIAAMLADLTVSGKGSVDDGKIQIDTANLKAQGNDVALRGSVVTKGALKLDLNVSSKKLDLDGLQKKLASGETPAAAASDKASAKSSSSGIAGFSVPFDGRVVANVGQLTVGGKTYSNIDADITNSSAGLRIAKFSAGLPASTTVDVSGSIADTQKLSGLDVKVSGQTGDTEKLLNAFMTKPLALPQKIGAASLNGQFKGSLEQLAFDTTIGTRGLALTGKGNVKDVATTPIINELQFAAKHASFVDAVRIISPGFDGGRSFAGPLSVTGQVKWSDKQQYQVTDLKGVLGPTTVGGNISVSMAGKPDVAGTLTFGDVVLPTTVKSAGGSVSAGSANAGTASAGGHWSRDPIDTSFLKSFDADVKVSARSITQGLWILSNANLETKLKDGVLNINDLSANLFGGKAAMSGTIRAGAAEHDPLSVDAKITANNVDARSAMSAAMGAASDTVSGTLTDLNVSVNAKGATQAAIVQTLAGSGSLSGKNLVVKGVDAAQLAMAAKGSYKPLERASSAFDSFGKGQTEFTDVNSTFTIENGIVNFTKLFFDGPKASLTSTGNVNLPQWTVNLKNSMTVKDTDIPAFDFTIKGPLDNPSKAGGDIINNYLNKKLEKGVNKLIEKNLGKFLGGGSTENAAPAASAPVAADGATAAPAADAASATPAQAAPALSDKQKAKQEAVKALQGLFGAH